MSNDLTENHESGSILGKVVEIKRPVEVFFGTAFYAPTSGLGRIEAYSGVKFEVIEAMEDGRYLCRSVDRSFDKATLVKALADIKPWLRGRFGGITGYTLPLEKMIQAGEAEVVDWEEPEPDDEYGPDLEEGLMEILSDYDPDDDDSALSCGYPCGYEDGVSGGNYMVIDLLTNDDSKRVTYLRDMPKGGWTDEFKTTKIVLKLIRGGEFTMGTDRLSDVEKVNPPHRVQLPNDFYIGIFPVTKKQVELVVNSTNHEFQVDAESGACPMDNVSYCQIRGLGRDYFDWPESANVSEMSFLGRLRRLCGIKNIDIPTAAQWEYACTAGGVQQQSNAEDVAKTAWSEENSDGRSHPVGQLQPNAWGLYDMLGNVWEWCLDWYGENACARNCEGGTQVSPAGTKLSTLAQVVYSMDDSIKEREIRGGGWNDPHLICHASNRKSCQSSFKNNTTGFRLAVTLRKKGVSAEDVRHILEQITVRGEDDGEKFTNTARVDAIASCLKESGWEPYHDGDLAKIYVRRDFDDFDLSKPVVVVSSHVDIVAERCYAKCDGELWKGSFDNLITNAVIVACMKAKVFGANVMVAFTGDEEADDGFGGADEVAKVLSKKEINLRCVVVTDVTEEGWEEEKAFTIENVMPEDDEWYRRKMVKHLKEAVADTDSNPCVIMDGEPDEAWEYDEYNIPCCSVCMPCRGDMHSEEGVEIHSSGIKAYSEALAAVANHNFCA